MCRVISASSALLVTLLLACSAPAAAPPTKPTAAPVASAPGASAPSAPSAAAPAAPPPRRPINYGLVNFSAFYWPLYVGLDEGLYDAAGFDVETLVTRSGPDGMAAMLGGSVDVNTMNTEVIVLAQARGADVIGVAGLHNKAVYSMMVQPEISQIGDLRGKTLGASALRAGEVIFMKALLQKYGLSERDYDLVVAGPSRNRVSAMTTHQLAGTIMPPPDSFILEDAGIKNVAEITEAVPDYEFQMLAVTRAWAQANDDALVRFVRAHVGTLKWLYDPANKERAIAILRERMQLSDDHARRTYASFIDQQQMFSRQGEISPAGLTAMEEMLVASGEATPPLPGRDRYIDLRYVERAQQP
jgi:ABC-type nitrate/sulfonate/bicarbonate transport system substrate-binding protein